jgi:chromate transporter
VRLLAQSREKSVNVVLFLQLFTSFFSIGTIAFGGGYATLPIIQAEVVTSRQWISEALFVDLISIAQMTPGPIAINTATFVGYQMAGIAGAVVATVGLITSPILLVALLAFILHRHRDHPAIGGVMKALAPALIALITFSVITVGRVSFSGIPPVLLSLLWFGLLLRSRIHPIVIICSSVIAGIVFL